MRIVTCIGDSETYCLGLARNQAWPYQLCVALDGGGTPSLGTLSPWSGTLGSTGAQREHVGTNWTVRNAGISSDTTRGFRARFATDVLGPAVKPDYCIIMGAENDFYYAAPTQVNDPTYGLDYYPGGLKDNYAWMAAECVANGIVPIFATQTPHGTLEIEPDRWPMAQDWLKWLGSTMTWMSTSETPNTLGVPLIDVYKAVYDGVLHPAYPQHYPSGSTYSIDNIHPNAAGALVIAAAAAVVVAAANLPHRVTLTPATETDSAQALAYSLRTLGLTLDSDDDWQQSGTALTVHAGVGQRREVTGVVSSDTGGECSFRGPDAADFEVSLNGTDWSPSVIVPAGDDTPIWLAVTASSTGAISAEVGVPE